MVDLHVEFDTNCSPPLVRLVRRKQRPRVIESWKPFRIRFTNEEQEDFRWYFEDFINLARAGGIVRARAFERSLDSWSLQLYDQLFDSRIGSTAAKTLISAPPPRLITICSSDGDILRLPWELMANTSGYLLEQGVTIRRQERTYLEVATFSPVLPINVLIVVSRPDGVEFIEPRYSTKMVIEELERLGQHVSVDLCRPATFERLNALLETADAAGRRYSVVHFDGHGTSDGIGGFLFFEHLPDAGGGIRPDPVAAARLGRLLARFHVQFVILEACRSAEVLTTAVEGVAPNLLRAGVPAVVGMSHAVHVEATRLFVRHLYDRLVLGARISEAVDAGRVAMLVNPERSLRLAEDSSRYPLRDWFLPQLYQLPADQRIVPPVEKEKIRGGETKWSDRLVDSSVQILNLPVEPKYGLHGREFDLHRLDRLLLQFQSVLLTGMYGVGKTAIARELAMWGVRTGLYSDGVCFLPFNATCEGAQLADAINGSLGMPLSSDMSLSARAQRAANLIKQRDCLLVLEHSHEVIEAELQSNTPTGKHTTPMRTSKDFLEALCNALVEGTVGKGRLLVTSRTSWLTFSCEAAHHLTGLHPLHCRDLLQRGLTEWSGDPDALRHLIREVAGYPRLIESLITALPGRDAGNILRNLAQAIEASVEYIRRLLQFVPEHLQPHMHYFSIFRAGVHDSVFKAASGIPEGAWLELREVLLRLGLLDVDDSDFICFMPALPYAVGSPSSVSRGEPRIRFVMAYFVFVKEMHQVLQSPRPADAVRRIAKEEDNLRLAIEWASEDDVADLVDTLSDTYREFLTRANRLADRDAFVMEVANRMSKAGFSRGRAGRLCDAAWSIFMGGDKEKAVALLLDLIHQLRSTTEFDASFKLALAYQRLGKIHLYSDALQDAVQALEVAVKQWSRLYETARGPENKGSVGTNLSTSLGDLANALGKQRLYQDAIEAAQWGIELDEALGHRHDAAIGQFQLATIYLRMEHWDKAKAILDLLLEYSEHEGGRQFYAEIVLQCGTLAYHQERFAEAHEFLVAALDNSVDAANTPLVIAAYTVLAAIEADNGRFPEARTWYNESLTLAERRDDRELRRLSLNGLASSYIDEAAALVTSGQSREAQLLFERALPPSYASLEICEETDDSQEEIATRQVVGLVLINLQRTHEGIDQFEKAMKIADELGRPDKRVQTIAHLVNALRSVGQEDRAVHWEQELREITENNRASGAT